MSELGVGDAAIAFIEDGVFGDLEWAVSVDEVAITQEAECGGGGISPPVAVAADGMDLWTIRLTLSGEAVRVLDRPRLEFRAETEAGAVVEAPETDPPCVNSGRWPGAADVALGRDGSRLVYAVPIGTRNLTLEWNTGPAPPWFGKTATWLLPRP